MTPIYLGLLDAEKNIRINFVKEEYSQQEIQDFLREETKNYLKKIISQ